MSKWLRSTSNLTYTAQGKVIPSYDKAPLMLSDSEFEKISKMPVIASLIANNGVIVLNKYEAPADVRTAADTRMQALATENARLHEELAKAQVEPATTKEVKAAKKAQADAEKKLAELEAKYAELEKEANEKIAELSAAKE